MHAIKFNPTSEIAEQIATPPRPAHNYSPSWYKDLKPFASGQPTIHPYGPSEHYGAAEVTAKLCLPFGDSMHAGYIQEAWQDIYFEIVDNTINFILSVATPPMISERESATFPANDFLYSQEFVFHPPWTPEVPAGWSVLYLSPLNRPELPMWFASGLVDNDTFTHSLKESQLPFYLKKTFKGGIIPKGTPLYQMIPIKRESWQSGLQEFDKNRQIKTGLMPRTRFWGGYKRDFWHKKEYR